MQASDLPGVSAGDKGGQYLSFTLGGEDYGLDILKVKEIRGWETVRPLPDTPDYIKGVLDMRGTIVPIVDLRLRFGVGEAAYTPTTVIIVVSTQAEDRDQTMGMVVDGVSDVLDVSDETLMPAPNLGTAISTRFIRGMVTRDSRMVVLLDVDKLLSTRDLGMLQDLS
jgi:purine-binding chemotaxis protein CheW